MSKSRHSCAVTAVVLTLLGSTITYAQNPYPTPTRDGRERIQRTGACPSGYIGKGDKCEAMHTDTPRAYPKIEGKACPSGTFSSGDACKSFR